MSYKSSEKTRQKKDAKRTAMMQSAVQVFAEKGYHAATVRDVVSAAGVAIGTFYFYFPDKETLFGYLYDETADFLLQTIEQAVNSPRDFKGQLEAGLQSYVSLGVYEPAVVHLLLVGGVGAVPSLAEKRLQFRERMIGLWKRALDDALSAGEIVDQNTRLSAEFLAGGFDENILNLLAQPNPDSADIVPTMSEIALRAVGFKSPL